MVQHETKYETERRLKKMTQKERLIGLDMDTLQKQAEMKQHAAMEERAVQHDDDTNALLVYNHMNLVEIATQSKRRELEIEVREFSKKHLGKDQRREYDLNDPDMLKKERPLRENENDPNLGVSAAQKFEGEDLRSKESMKLQYDQQRAWIQSQMYEKAVEQEAERGQLAEEKEIGVQVNNLRGAIEKAEEDARKELRSKMTQANAYLSDVKKAKEAREKEEIQEADRKELELMVDSAFLSEIPVLNPDGSVVSKCKSLDDKIQGKHDILAQIEMNQKLKMHDAEDQFEFDQQSEHTRRILLCMDHEKNMRNRNNRMSTADENKKLAEEQRARREAEKHERRHAQVGNIFEDS